MNGKGRFLRSFHQVLHRSEFRSVAGIVNSRSGFATLAYEEVVVPGQPRAQENRADPAGDHLCTALIIHGLFGTGRNWRSPAKSLAELVVKSSSPGTPGWRLVLVDLRNHGKSAQLAGFNPPHTIEAAGRDIVNLVAESAWEGAPVVIGHSLGGKVALEYARITGADKRALNARKPEQVWILDSVPGPIVEADQGDVEKVLATLRSLPDPVPSRRWLTGNLQELGYSRGLAEWMASNLRKAEPSSGGEEMTWIFNVEAAADMYDSYRISDYLPLLENLPSSMRVDFVRAERSDRWQPEVLVPLEAVAKKRPGAVGEETEGVGLHVLPNAGHWLHMDNPKGLVELLAPSLTRIAEKWKR